jgi:hypothetical protein
MINAFLKRVFLGLMFYLRYLRLLTHSGVKTVICDILNRFRIKKTSQEINGLRGRQEYIDHQFIWTDRSEYKRTKCPIPIFTNRLKTKYSGVQHISCCGFVLFVLVLFTLYSQFLWIVHSWFFSVRYSLSFIYFKQFISILRYIL